ncbi:hypothetical protein [Desulfosporosinus sp. BG]|uniref:hypothetical protein n=1 Tax=Desulfosporosinus sp. BG TaxID=1633135 RepID=UPI00083AFFDA|nr:hypothetical protein [Desulfosporosinus sp. BG]ODA40462.1 hypothetical protein DSBG_2779 [Desulfosporosinus sp. BG]
MTKKILLISAFLVSILVSGCTSQNNSWPNADVHATNKVSQPVINSQQQNANSTQANANSPQTMAETVNPLQKTEKSTSNEHYTNPRFGFSIDYPSTFSVHEEPPEDGDGMGVKTPDGHATIIAYGANVCDWDVNYFYQEALNARNVTYKIQKGNWYVVSWLDRDTIGYTKGIVGRVSMNAFVIQYPKTEQQIYSHVIDILSATFKTPGIGEIH